MKLRPAAPGSRSNRSVDVPRADDRYSVSVGRRRRGLYSLSAGRIRPCRWSGERADRARRQVPEQPIGPASARLEAPPVHRRSVVRPDRGRARRRRAPRPPRRAGRRPVRSRRQRAAPDRLATGIPPVAGGGVDLGWRQQADVVFSGRSSSDRQRRAWPRISRCSAVQVGRSAHGTSVRPRVARSQAGNERVAQQRDQLVAAAHQRGQRRLLAERPQHLDLGGQAVTIE